MQDNYDDIIHLPHHISPNHRRMEMHQRAAQFSPFAALQGHKESLERTLCEHIIRWEK